MAKVTLEWDGVPEMQDQLRIYGQKVKEAVRRVAEYFAPIIERYAKENANWTDRTANARQSLRAYLGDAPPDAFSAEGATDYPDAGDLAADVVALYLSHGMNYGAYLELANQGRYAIILEALEAHYAPIMQMLQGIFG